MRSLGIIPARYESTRFRGKALVDIMGKPMIQRVYEQAVASDLDEVIIATDDDLIYDVAKQFGGEVMMTSAEHRNGTERCIEVVELLRSEGHNFDVVVNVQGDEPFVQPSQINLLLTAFQDEVLKPNVATLIKKITTEEELFNPNVVKVVAVQQFYTEIWDVLYFSRQAIPYLRGVERSKWVEEGTYYKHIGMYAFDAECLEEEIKELEPSPLEEMESLEQLRWLEDHMVISALVTEEETIGIDTPEDLERALAWFKANQNR
ncbi:MAG: 3-deoxy-manno-octulosonate cytidylyltransferase [Aureispira sp.]|nr:3-deoxy-manno-octulosonate cytidylyltransferase [Aureispira sp.]